MRVELPFTSGDGDGNWPLSSYSGGQGGVVVGSHGHVAFDPGHWFHFALITCACDTLVPARTHSEFLTNRSLNVCHCVFADPSLRLSLLINP